jgi:hypothetical protein
MARASLPQLGVTSGLSQRNEGGNREGVRTNPDRNGPFSGQGLGQQGVGMEEGYGQARMDISQPRSHLRGLQLYPQDNGDLLRISCDRTRFVFHNNYCVCGC